MFYRRESACVYRVLCALINETFEIYFPVHLLHVFYFSPCIHFWMYWMENFPFEFRSNVGWRTKTNSSEQKTKERCIPEQIDWFALLHFFISENRRVCYKMNWLHVEICVFVSLSVCLIFQLIENVNFVALLPLSQSNNHTNAFMESYVNVDEYA